MAKGYVIAVNRLWHTLFAGFKQIGTSKANHTIVKTCTIEESPIRFNLGNANAMQKSLIKSGIECDIVNFNTIFHHKELINYIKDLMKEERGNFLISYDNSEVFLDNNLACFGVNVGRLITMIDPYHKFKNQAARVLSVEQTYLAAETLHGGETFKIRNKRQMVITES